MKSLPIRFRFRDLVLSRDPISNRDASRTPREARHSWAPREVCVRFMSVTRLEESRVHQSVGSSPHANGEREKEKEKEKERERARSERETTGYEPLES